METPVKILLVCGESKEREFLKNTLSTVFYRVTTAESKQQITDFISTGSIDLLITDLVLKEFETILLLRELKESSIEITFTILLTDRSEDFIHIIAFESGVDDIIEKPIKPGLFLARINAIVRRKFKIPLQDKETQAAFIVDPEKYLVFKNNRPIELPKKEFELLNLLCSNPGKVFSRYEIANRIWNGTELGLESRSIDTHVRNLRNKIGSEIIKSIKGVGYGLAYCELTSSLFVPKNY